MSRTSSEGRDPMTTEEKGALKGLASSGVEALIERLRDEGVQVGQAEAQRIEAEARREAARIVRDAENRAKADPRGGTTGGRCAAQGRRRGAADRHARHRAAAQGRSRRSLRRRGQTADRRQDRAGGIPRAPDPGGGRQGTRGGRNRRRTGRRGPVAQGAGEPRGAAPQPAGAARRILVALRALLGGQYPRGGRDLRGRRRHRRARASGSHSKARTCTSI